MDYIHILWTRNTTNCQNIQRHWHQNSLQNSQHHTETPTTKTIVKQQIWQYQCLQTKMHGMSPTVHRSDRTIFPNKIQRIYTYNKI
jgi:hypothetical protein